MNSVNSKALDHHKIILLFEAGVSRKELMKQFQITKGNLYQVIRKSKMFESTWSLRKKELKVFKDIQNSLNNSRPLEEVLKQYNLTQESLNQLFHKFTRKCFNTWFYGDKNGHLIERNKTIVQMYKDGITSTIIAEKYQITLPMVFQILRTSNYQKFPVIQTRHVKGSVFEDKKTLQLIKKLNKKGFHCLQIATYLNGLGLKTISGKKFSEAMISYRLRQVNKKTERPRLKNLSKYSEIISAYKNGIKVKDLVIKYKLGKDRIYEILRLVQTTKTVK